jgi:large subunit ribosomal protein L6
VLHPIPEGIKVVVAENTKISISASTRKLSARLQRISGVITRQSPTRAKGVRYVGEVIRRKEGKTVQ